MEGSSMLIRLPDGNGGQDTYLPTCELAAVVDVTRGTVYQWEESGAVRFLVRRGKRYAALADAVLVRIETPQQTHARGVLRSSQGSLKATREYIEAEQAKTLSEATRRCEMWEATEDAVLVRLHEDGVDYETIALRLGRTYRAVATRLGQVLDREHDRDYRWLHEAAQMLTEDEVDRILGAIRA